ncbi:MAG TPA: SDR family NAD(P)-dependent oxidoreductase [Motilibacteraceae bacterium]|nr:SDR family NAD(P)-dependent oxidoreductase [Motilibacteraceae bacterium]
MTTPTDSRVVVVTGASSGIGRATALQLSARGDTVVLVSRSDEALSDTASECLAAGGRVMSVPADVADEQAMSEVLRRTLERFGRIDAWVQTAAVVAYGRVEEVPPDAFERVLRTNLLGSAVAARVVVPQFREQRHGVLVLVGSLLDRVVVPYMSPYVVSKWGVRALARTLAIENRDLPDLHVCLVAPGAVDTPIYDQAGTYTGRPGTPPPPVMPPERVAAAVVRRLDRPKADTPVGLSTRLVRLGFVTVPWLFDRLVGPLERRFGLGGRPIGPDPGNLHEPRPDREAVHGGWSRAGTRE